MTQVLVDYTKLRGMHVELRSTGKYLRKKACQTCMFLVQIEMYKFCERVSGMQFTIILGTIYIRTFILRARADDAATYRGSVTT